MAVGICFIQIATVANTDREDRQLQHKGLSSRHSNFSQTSFPIERTVSGSDKIYSLDSLKYLHRTDESMVRDERR